jgi:hypothetical protein
MQSPTQKTCGSCGGAVKALSPDFYMAYGGQLSIQKAPHGAALLQLLD